MFLSHSQNNITKNQYLALSKLAKSTEVKILNSQKTKHENKLIYANYSVGELRINPAHYVPEKTIKHHDTLCKKRRRRNQRRRVKMKEKRHNRNLGAKIGAIKAQGLVVNLTDNAIPDCALLYLSNGSSFVPAIPTSLHDIVYDSNEFIRKLHWRTLFNTTIEVPENNGTGDSPEVHPKLRISSNKWPNIKNKLLDNVCSKITNLVNSIEVSKIKKYNNLTFLEKKGLHWCIKMKQNKIIHFSQADKGGAIVLLDPNVVNEVILSELQNPSKYILLPSDPRAKIESDLHNLCKNNLTNNGLNKSELFLITGHSDKGKSHNPVFSAGKPNPFPLFKLHSISPEDLANKITPPHRLVTSMKYGPTKRPALFIDSILTPVSISYCGR